MVVAASKRRASLSSTLHHHHHHPSSSILVFTLVLLLLHSLLLPSTAASAATTRAAHHFLTRTRPPTRRTLAWLQSPYHQHFSPFTTRRPPSIMPHKNPWPAPATRDGTGAEIDDNIFRGTPLKDRKKRRVALVIGYVGTNYSGLQKSEGTAPTLAEGEPTPQQVITIESTLEKALFDAGYIRESNYGDLDKIGWARCSRTDKGVHAARNVVSAKLELRDGECDGEGPNGLWSELTVEEVNACLPDDIRVLSAAKVTKSFRPRDAVSFREYEYLLPVELLYPLGSSSSSNTAVDDDALIARFCEILVKYQGTHNFHNFTKIKSRDLIRRLKAKVGAARGGEWVHKNARGEDEQQQQQQQEAAATTGSEKVQNGNNLNNLNVDDDDDDDDNDSTSWETPTVAGLSTAKIDGIRRFNTGVALNPLFQILRASPQNQQAINDKRRSDKPNPNVEHVPIGDPADGVTTALWDLTRYQGVLKMVRTNIYRCEGRPLEVGGRKFVSVTFHGSSFLYNQIRLLIGGAIGVVSGLLPEDALTMALDSPYLVYSPLAPAEGLYLRQITFGRKSKNPVVMHEADLPTAEELVEIGTPQVYALLNYKAAERAEEFERKRILTEIVGAWTPELLSEWRRYAEHFEVSEEVGRAMSEKYVQWKESIEKLEEAKAARELFRRQSMASWMEREAAAAAGNTAAASNEDGEGATQTEGGGEGGESQWPGVTLGVEREVFRSYRKWMPQRFATDVIIRFRLKPGKQVGMVQRGLAMWMVQGKVSASATTEELFALIEEKGGTEFWENEGGKVTDGRGGRGGGGGEEGEAEDGEEGEGGEVGK